MSARVKQVWDRFVAGKPVVYSSGDRIAVAGGGLVTWTYRETIVASYRVFNGKCAVHIQPPIHIYPWTRGAAYRVRYVQDQVARLILEVRLLYKMFGSELDPSIHLTPYEATVRTVDENNRLGYWVTEEMMYDWAYLIPRLLGYKAVEVGFYPRQRNKDGTIREGYYAIASIEGKAVDVA